MVLYSPLCISFKAMRFPSALIKWAVEPLAQCPSLCWRTRDHVPKIALVFLPCLKLPMGNGGAEDNGVLSLV